QYQSTVEQAQKALKAIEKSEDGTTIYHGLIHFYIGRAQLDARQFEAAKASLKECEKIYEKHPPEDAMYRNNLALALADLFFETQAFAEAKPYYQQTLAQLQQETNNYNADQVKLVVYQRIAELSEQLREYETAVSNYEAFLEAFAEILGDDHPGYQRVARHRQQLITALAAKEAGFSAPQIPIQYSEEEADHLSRHYAQWLVSPHPLPNQASLTKLLQKAEQLRILSGQPNELQERKLITEGSQLGPIKASFRIEAEPQGHTLKEGGTCFQWEDKQGAVLGQIWYLGDGIIRWSGGWKGDAHLEWADRFENRLEEYFEISQ
ncbi:MAG: hypothetical protein AAFN10_18845, partial [Bacteroidota bacterium]